MINQNNKIDTRIFFFKGKSLIWDTIFRENHWGRNRKDENIDKINGEKNCYSLKRKETKQTSMWTTKIDFLGFFAVLSVDKTDYLCISWLFLFAVCFSFLFFVLFTITLPLAHLLLSLFGLNWIVDQGARAMDILDDRMSKID